MFLGIDKISCSISSSETGSKKKEPELLLDDKYSVNLWDELGNCVAKLSPTDVKYLLKMLEISRRSFVVLLSLRCFSEDTTLDFFPQSGDCFRGWRRYCYKIARGQEYSGSPDGKCIRQLVSIKFFLHSKTRKREVFPRRFFHMKTSPLLNNRKSQIPRVTEDIKILCSLKYRVVEMEFSSDV